VKIKIVLLLVIAFSAICANSQNGPFQGMANASVSLSELWSISNNQAGLAKLKNIQAGVYYHNNYTLYETAHKGVVLLLPSQYGNFSMCYNHYGYELYSEHKSGVSYSRTLGKYISAGVQFNYLQYGQPQYYGSRGVPVLETGIVAEPVENMSIGFHVFNPTNTSLAGYISEKVQAVYRFGLSYSFSHDVLLSTEVYKSIFEPVRFKLGLQYEAVKALHFRAGIITEPAQFSFGTGYTFANFVSDVSIQTHPQLPLSYSFSIKYIF